MRPLRSIFGPSCKTCLLGHLREEKKKPRFNKEKFFQDDDWVVGMEGYRKRHSHATPETTLVKEECQSMVFTVLLKPALSSAVAGGTFISVIWKGNGWKQDKTNEWVTEQERSYFQVLQGSRVPSRRNVWMLVAPSQKNQPRSTAIPKEQVSASPTQSQDPHWRPHFDSQSPQNGFH